MWSTFSYHIQHPNCAFLQYVLIYGSIFTCWLIKVRSTKILKQGSKAIIDIHLLQIISFINKREFKCDSNFYLQSTGEQNCPSSKIDITFINAIFEGVESS